MSVAAGRATVFILHIGLCSFTRKPDVPARHFLGDHVAQTNILLESGTNELELVEFFIDERDRDTQEVYRGYYGVNVAKVLEIIRLPQVTHMPETSHSSVLGAFNLRDKVIPLVDLSTWLNKEQVDTENAKVIVAEFNQTTSAFMVSGVTRIHRISWQDVEPPGNHVSTFTNDSITGVVRFDERIMLILDMEKILGDLIPSLAMDDTGDEELERPSAKEVYKALIADDSTSIRRMIAATMTRSGFDVDAHVNGKEAWEQLLQIKATCESSGKPISDFVDVIVSDIEMPAMDGHNLTKRIKDDPVLRNIPVVLFSSLITERLRHKGEKVGADDQVSKPNISTLTKKAYTLIEQYQGIDTGRETFAQPTD